MSKAKIMSRAEDIRRMLEVKELAKRRKDSNGFAGSDAGSDRSDLSTQSMPQYSSYRTLSGGLFGPFEDSPSRPSPKTGFFQRTSTSGKSKLDSISSRLRSPSTIMSRTRGDSVVRSNSPMMMLSPDGGPGTRGGDASLGTPRLPIFRREASMPVIRRDGGSNTTSIPQIRRHKIDLNRPRSKTASNKTSPAAAPTPRGSKQALVTPLTTTPKTVEERKITERNNAARGTRSGVSGISDKVMIGDSVRIISSQKKGIIQFVGDTRFSKGTWIGVVLEDATGKNDGSIGGVRYFTCPALRGVFVREDKLEKIENPSNGQTKHLNNNKPNQLRKPIMKDNINTLSDHRNDSSLSTDSGVCVEDGSHHHSKNNSINNNVGLSEENDLTLTLGDRVQISSTTGTRIGTLRFIGTTEFAKGTWCGVELNEETGKNDGAVAGTRYFQCQPRYGIFAQLGKVSRINTTSQSAPSPSTSSSLSPKYDTASRPKLLSFSTQSPASSTNGTESSSQYEQHNNNPTKLPISESLPAKATLSSKASTSIDNTNVTRPISPACHHVATPSTEFNPILDVARMNELHNSGTNNNEVLSNGVGGGDELLSDVDEALKAMEFSFAGETHNISFDDTSNKNPPSRPALDIEVSLETPPSKAATQFNTDNYEQQLAQLIDKLKKSVDQNEELKFKMDELEAEAGDAQQAQFEVIRLNELNSMNEEKIASYETQLQHLRSHVQQLEQQQQQQQNLPSVDYQKLKTENEALSSTHRASEQEMETLRKEISDLKTDKSFIDEESTILRQEKDDLKEELEKHKDSFNELKKRNEEFAQQIQMLHAENQRLVNSNHLSKKNVKDETSSLPNKYQENHQEDEREEMFEDGGVEQLQNDVERLTSMLTKTTMEIEELNISLLSVTNERDSLLDEKEEELLMQKSSDTTSSNNTTTTDDENEQPTTLTTATTNSEEHTTIAALQETIEKLTKEKKSIQEKYEMLTEQYVEKEHALVNVHKDSRLAIESEKLSKESLESKNNELSQKLETSDSVVASQNNQIQQLKTKITTLESDMKLNCSLTSGEFSSSQYKKLHDEMEEMKNLKDEKQSEVTFLNSIIVDLQKKNKEYEDKIKILSYGDDLEQDFAPMQPISKVRAFCDICDVFDSHETEDCPLQSNDQHGGTSNGDTRKQNGGQSETERPYCDICEVFGHTAENCDDEEKSKREEKHHTNHHHNKKSWFKRRFIGWKPSL